MKSKGRFVRVLVPGVACAALAACGSGAGNGSASSTSGAGSKASASSSASGKADMAFYKGKTVTIIAPDKPGGSFDSWSRLLATYMSKYLHATVKVRNIPPGNTIVGQNTLASSTPNGLTMGWINGGEDVAGTVKGNTGLTFKPEDLPYVGGVAVGILTILAQPSSPYHSIADLQKATKPIPTLDVTRGTNNLILRTIVGVYHIKAKIITGYENTKDLAAGFLRKDGVLTPQEIVPMESAIENGKARALVVTSAVPKQNPAYSELKNVPTLQQLYQNNPPKNASDKQGLKVLINVLSAAQSVAVPVGTPAGRLAALRAAMQWSLQQPGLKNTALKEGLNPTFVPGPQVGTIMKTSIKKAQVLKPYLTSS